MASYLTHFTTVSSPPNEEGSSIDIPELTNPGQILLTVDNVGEAAQLISLEQGDYTTLNEEGTEITGTVHGYPRPNVTSGATGTTASINLLPLVTVAEDLMEARLNLYPPIPDKNLPTVEEIKEILHQSRVLHNIDTHGIEQVLQKVKLEKEPVFDLIIARGKAPVHGKDAWLRMEIEIGPLPGTLLANGSIDFRERRMFVGVKKGELIATRVPATSGKQGMNLAGDLIPARDGKELSVKVTGDTTYNEADGAIRATTAGVLCAVGDDTLRVASKQKIEGDVGFATGNIRSQNSLEISGSVLPDFLVSAGGNLLIGGDIQAGRVKCRSNIEIKGGIVGRESEVHARGDIDVKYIERGELSAEGNIVIRKNSYYSNLQSGESIHCPEEALLVGGTIISRGSLSAGRIGSASATPISIAVGVDPGRYRRYKSLMEKYDELLQQIQSQVHYYGRNDSEEMGIIPRLEKRMQKIERELATLNLIPDTPETSLGEDAFFHTDVTIKAHLSIAAGTKIRIGNDTTVISNDLGKCTVKMDEETGAILFKTGVED